MLRFVILAVLLLVVGCTSAPKKPESPPIPATTDSSGKTTPVAISESYYKQCDAPPKLKTRAEQALVDWAEAMLVAYNDCATHVRDHVKLLERVFPQTSPTLN